MSSGSFRSEIRHYRPGTCSFYDELPKPLRFQIVHIWSDTLGNAEDRGHFGEQGVSSRAWHEIAMSLAREHGVLRLAKGRTGFEQAFNYLITERRSANEQLDLVQRSFQMIDTFMRENEWQFQSAGFATQTADEAILELNYRFLENGVGYQYLAGEIVRVDGTYQHAQVIRPALTLLTLKEFENAEIEFLRAHEHYRHGRYEEALSDAAKAFESAMKIICHELSWKIDPKDSAKSLINTLLENGLIASHFQEQLTALRQLLESGTATVRNKMGAHGMGVERREIPAYVAAYALQSAAANISLLVSAFQSRNPKRRRIASTQNRR